MKIVSNNTIKLEEVHRTLKKDGKANNIDINNISVEGTMGFEVELVLQAELVVNLDLHELLADMFKSYLGYRLIKKVTIHNKEKTEEIIDVEVLTDKEKVKELNIDNDSILEIEYKER